MISALSLAIAASAGPAEMDRAVDALQTCSRAGLGYGAQDVWPGLFLGEPYEDRFGGRVTTRIDPRLEPPIASLVRSGVAAVPSLLSHLRDARQTGITVRFAEAWFGREYDPRIRSLAGERLWINTPTPTSFTDRFGLERYRGHAYRLCVGDLCYLILGQIVDRRLYPVWFPRRLPARGSVGIINSPVHDSELAEQARRDWGHVSSEELIRSLERDTVSVLNGRIWRFALQRLRYYFPDSAARFASDLLTRPIEHLSGPSWLARLLVENPNLPNLDMTVKNYAGSHSAASMDLVAAMVMDAALLERTSTARRTAAASLKKFFPGVDPMRPLPGRTIEVSDVSQVLRETRRVPSRQLDAAAVVAFEHCRQAPIEGYTDCDDVDDVAFECVDRLGLKEPFLGYLMKRGAQLKPAAGYITVPRRLKEIQNLLRRRIRP